MLIMIAPQVVFYKQIVAVIFNTKIQIGFVFLRC